MIIERNGMQIELTEEEMRQATVENLSTPHRRDGNHLWVCDRCLAGIECHEGWQYTMAHSVDATDPVESACDWCEEDGFDTLHELL